MTIKKTEELLTYAQRAYPLGFSTKSILTIT